MEGVMNEGGLEGWKMQKHVQVSVENNALVQCNVHEEQVQAKVEVGETSTTNLAIIEVDSGARKCSSCSKAKER
jgi:hypothetical protein